MIRKFLNDVHLWVGLCSGILVILICLSGTIYVFNTEIRELSQPSLYHVNRSRASERLPIKTLIEGTARETGGKVISVKIPSDFSRAYILSVRKEDESKDHKNGAADKKADGILKPGQVSGPPTQSRGVQYMVDPYTGKILGSSTDKTAVTQFMAYMFSLHRWLLLDRIEKPVIGTIPNRTLGSYISGTVSILFTIGVITGFMIWFPRKIRNWKQGFTIKWSGNWKRLNHDLHSTLGFYSCIFLFLMGITGPQWSFPWYREGLKKALGTYQPERGKKAEAPGSVMFISEAHKTLYLEDYIKTADKELDYRGDYTISLPVDSSDAITLSKVRKGFFASPSSDKLILDQYSSAILKRDLFMDKPLNERISASIKAIHVGEVYGKFTKILYFLACLIATSLPITGTLIWLNKLKIRTGKTKV